jgi:hypothetical protein
MSKWIFHDISSSMLVIWDCYTPHPGKIHRPGLTTASSTTKNAGLTVTDLGLNNMTIGLVNLEMSVGWLSRLPGCHRKHKPNELCGARGYSKMVGVRKSWFSKATFEIICLCFPSCIWMRPRMEIPLNPPKLCTEWGATLFWGAIPISPYLIAAPGDCQMRKSMRSGREPVAWARPFGRWHQDLSDGTWYDSDITKLWVWGLGDLKI